MLLHLLTETDILIINFYKILSYIMGMLLYIQNEPAMTQDPVTTTATRSTEPTETVDPVVGTSSSEPTMVPNQVATTSSSKSSKMKVSYDAAWCTRGTGRSYNSIASHGTFLGKNTGLCLSYATKSKQCRICQHAENKNEVPRSHDCFKNWQGSSKAMEPAMAVDMLQQLRDEGTEVNTLIMDNDTTTISRARAEFDNKLEKEDDQNHTKKSLISSLYALRAKHKNLNNGDVLDYITRMFMYPIQQNQGNAEKIRDELGTIVPHIYGDLQHCTGQWCTYKRNPENYRYKSLPHGKPLSDPGWFMKMLD